MLKFEIGKTYEMISICDSNCKWSYKVIKRTAKTVDLFNGIEIIKCRIKECEISEMCKPLGSYSFAPILRAKNIIPS